VSISRLDNIMRLGTSLRDMRAPFDLNRGSIGCGDAPIGDQERSVNAGRCLLERTLGSAKVSISSSSGYSDPVNRGAARVQTGGASANGLLVSFQCVAGLRHAC